MKKHIFFLVGAILLLVTTTQCDWGDTTPSSSNSNYFIYIIGDSGRTVDISYLQKEQSSDNKRENIIVSKKVTLPYFAETSAAQYIGDNVPDCFLTISTKNDSTTRAIIFTDNLPLADKYGKDSTLFSKTTGIPLVDTLCWVVDYFDETKELGESDYWKMREHCHCITKDSVVNYLKEIEYPCYLDFTAEDTELSIYLYDYWGYERE